MKAFAGLLMFIAVLGGAIMTIGTVDANYSYSNNVASYWSLSDKSSTIVQKSQYLDLFEGALEKQNLQGCHDALIYFTPDNSFDQNMGALKSLQLRFHEIQKMDVTSFQYQTAIQQITQQEQGEAGAMLSVFEGCYMKQSYTLLWGVYGIGLGIFLLLLFFIGGAILASSTDY